MVSTNTVCFEGICRIYRNSVVRNIREVLKSRTIKNLRDPALGHPAESDLTKKDALTQIHRKAGTWALAVEIP